MTWTKWIDWVVTQAKGGVFWLAMGALLSGIVTAFGLAVTAIFGAYPALPELFLACYRILGTLNEVLPLVEFFACAVAYYSLDVAIISASMLLKVVQWVTDLVPTGG